jgi:hypothetical protein
VQGKIIEYQNTMWSKKVDISDISFGWARRTLPHIVTENSA